jgi:hypothetical protein
MLRSAFLIVAGIVAALVVACVPGTPGTPPGLAVPPPPPPTCDATGFVSKVFYYTDPSFQPMKNGPLPPTVALPGSPDYLTGLRDAFNAAPPGFKQALCDLDAVYVNAAACTTWSDCFGASWGWLRKSMGTELRLVGLSSSLWGNDYAYYETVLTQSILPQSNIYYSQPQSCTNVGVCTSVNNLSTALLAALAHEVGHIRWFEWVNTSPGNYCSPDFFGNSWNQPYHRPPTGAAGGYWRHLLTRNHRSDLRSQGRYLDSHKNPPQINDIDVLAPGSAIQNQAIYKLLVPPSPAPPSPWASLFAAMSPDEDFVETYKFKVLTDRTPEASRYPLTSVWITVPQGQSNGSNGAANIVADYLSGARPYLAAKVDCITSY